MNRGSQWAQWALLARVRWRLRTRHAAACGVLLAAAALGAGCSWLPGEDAPLEPPLVAPAKTSVQTAEARRAAIERTVRGIGTFEPVRVAHHQFETESGRVSSVAVKAGDRVREGDVLLELERPDMRAELLRKQLEVERKRLSLEEAMATYDERRVRIARLELELAELELEQARQQMAGGRLLAQMDGVVIYMADIQAGDTAERYTRLVSVAGSSELRLAFAPSGNTAAREVQVGMEARITFDGAEYAGTVVQTPETAPQAADERQREQFGRTVFIQADGAVTGMDIGDFADVRIVTARRDDALVIPKQSVRQFFGRTYVQVLDGERRLEADVELGLETALEVEVLGGLREGQLVVLQ